MADPRKLADQQKRQRLALERVQTEQILAEYQRVWARIKSDLDVLTGKIRAARAEGTAVTRGWLIQQHILDTILAQVRAEMDVAARQIGRTLTQQQAQAVVDAQTDATNLIQANMPPSMVWEPKFPAAAFGELVGYAQDGQPLGDLLAELGPAAADSIRQSLLHGVALGQNPKQIARGVRSALGGNMARAVTIARTEVLRAHREASRATYQANRDVVTEWVWYAELDGRTCAVCWSMHGEVFDTDEMMETHPNCRCALLPRTKSWDELGFPGLKDTRVTVEPGADVFAKASEELQRQVLGPAKFEAYKAGNITLADLVQKTESPRWGGGRREASLESALDGKTPSANLPLGVAGGKTIEPAEVYYHGTGGSGGAPLTTGNPEWDKKFFITPDKAVAERYADRYIDGEVREVALAKSTKIFVPKLDPINYTPERLVAILRHAKEKGFGAVHFGGGIGTVVIDDAAVIRGARKAR